jgi:hypothetical protein
MRTQPVKGNRLQVLAQGANRRRVVLAVQRLFSGLLNESAMVLVKWSRRCIDPVGSCGGLGRPDSAGTSLRYPFSRDRTNSRTTQEKA